MDECVSKKEVLEILTGRATEYGRCMEVDKQSAVLGCIGAILMMKPTDVATVVHGEWIVGGVGANDVIGNWRCSVCNGTSSKDSKYCPHCRARMDADTPAHRMAQRLKERFPG